MKAEGMTPAHATVDFDNESHEFPARMMEENTRAQCSYMIEHIILYMHSLKKNTISTTSTCHCPFPFIYKLYSYCMLYVKCAV